MKALPILGVLVLAISTLACSAFRAPLTPPEKGGPPWIELRTAHFVVKTDVDHHTARKIAGDLEQSYAMLAFAIGHQPRGEEAPLDVVVFARKADFKEVAPRSAAAFFAAHLAADFEPRPVIVMPDSEIEEETRLLIQHELAHRFLHARYSNMPRWLDEGFAEYYAPAHVKDGRLIFGSATSVDFSKRPYHWIASKDGFEQLEVPLHSAPKLRELIEAGRDEFYPASGESGPSNKQRERQSALYAGAWRLVHLLMNGPNARHRSRFGAFLGDVERGERPRDAFLERFGDDWSGLDDAYRAYLSVERLPLRVVDVPATSQTTPIEREMSAREVHVLWARVLPWHEDQRAKVRSEVAAASALEPGALDMLLVRAMLALHDKDYPAAQAALDSAERQAPERAAVLSAQIACRDKVWRQAAGDNALFRSDDRRRALVDRLAKRATWARHLDIVAGARLFDGNVDDAMTFSARALAADPLCWTCYDTRAMIFLRQGKLDEAMAASDRALALSPERASIDALMETRRKIERARVDARERARLGNAAAPIVEPLGGAEGAPTFVHPIDPAGIQRVVRASFSTMRACYQAGLARNGNLRGLVKVRFVIGLDGLVREAHSLGERDE